MGRDDGRGAHAAPRSATSGVLSGVAVVLVLVAVVLLATRCGGSAPSAAPGSPPAPPTPAAAGGSGSSGPGSSEGGAGDAGAAQARERFRAATAGVPVVFDGNGTEMRPDAGAALDRIAAAAREAPGVVVLVTGHTAPVDGDPAWCQRLSSLRADLVADRLRAAGVASDRLRTVGVSHMYPAATWAASRRVEVAPG